MNAKLRNQPTQAGDIVTCFFPHAENVERPGPKLRPALVVKVEGELVGEFLNVAYGTGQDTPDKNTSRTAGAHYFHMDPAPSGNALKVQTTFNMAKVVRLPFTAEWFAPWPSRNTILVCRVPEARLPEAKAAFDAGCQITASRTGSPPVVTVSVKPRRRVVSLQTPPLGPAS